MIVADIQALRDKGAKIGITFSQFDLLHAGHVAMLADAKKHCDFLICGLQNDAGKDRNDKNSPVQSIIERQICLGAVRYVDGVIVYNTEEDLEDILVLYPIDIRIIGVEYRNREFTGRSLCNALGIEMVYNGRMHNFSSTELRERIKNLP